MKVVVAAGVVFMVFVVMTLTIMIPDTTEQTVLSWLANRANDAKQDAMVNSVEVQSLLIENEELQRRLSEIEKQIDVQALPMHEKVLAGAMERLEVWHVFTVALMAIGLFVYRSKKGKTVNGRGQP